MIQCSQLLQKPYTHIALAETFEIAQQKSHLLHQYVPLPCFKLKQKRKLLTIGHI